jgi:polyisoprenyl-teichoic acid--peptidoglycan teichoic acid transferase
MYVKTRALLIFFSLIFGAVFILSVPAGHAASAQDATNGAPPTNTKRPAGTALLATAAITLTPGAPAPTIATAQATQALEITAIEGFATPITTPVTPIPPAMPSPPANGDDILTVLLLGSDTITAGAVARTDVIILVAVNRSKGTVSMMHIPRDLFVYAPNDTMRKINTVMNEGNKLFGEGGGVKMIKDTIQYNLGLKVDYYARVDFVQFQKIILALGGLQISVDCAVQGNKLKSPDLDYTSPESYEVYTLNIGVHTLDPYTALWYVRARGSSSDLDRGRRQMEVLRAIWRQARSKGMLEQATVLLPEVLGLLETDMPAQEVLSMVPLALSIDPADVQRITLVPDVHFTQWFTADVGAFAWLPNQEAMRKAVQNLMLPPPSTILGGGRTSVQIAAAARYAPYVQVAADRLSWEGYAVTILPSDGVPQRIDTVLYDYTGGAKPEELESIRKTLRVAKNAVFDQPDPNATSDFGVIMGNQYGTSCFFGLPNQ